MTYKEEQEKKRQIRREHVKEVTGLLDTALSVIFAGHSDIRDEWTLHNQSLHDECLLVKEFADSDFSAYNEEYAEFRYNTLLKNFKTILAHAKNYLDTVLKNRAAVAKARKADNVRRILNTPRQSVCEACYTCQFYNVAANAEPCATCFYSKRKDNASAGNS